MGDDLCDEVCPNGSSIASSEPSRDVLFWSTANDRIQEYPGTNSKSVSAFRVSKSYWDAPGFVYSFSLRRMRRWQLT